MSRTFWDPLFIEATYAPPRPYDESKGFLKPCFVRKKGKVVRLARLGKPYSVPVDSLVVTNGSL